MLEPDPARLFRYHKPSGLLTTAHDPKGRPTIYDRLPKDLPRLMPIGRLDFTSEGLLLLTNDGGLKRRLELPATGWLRRYRVRVHGTVDETRLAGLARGIRVDGFDYGPIEAKIDLVRLPRRQRAPHPPARFSCYPRVGPRQTRIAVQRVVVTGHRIGRCGRVS